MYLGESSPFVFVIFGATGDLMARKLMPAMYTLLKKGEMSKNIFIIGVGRRELTDDQFRELMAAAVKDTVGRAFDQKVWNNLIDGMEYQQGYFEHANLYEALVAKLKRFDQAMKACVPRFFYLATPPQHYETILRHLDTSTLAVGCGQGTTNFTRILIEKPFGRDLETARSLDKLLASIFEEKQIYRIDHYLGKETVQNILAFRFANGMFEPTWNAEFIDHVQITLAEKEGVGHRGAFYDGVGALRDVMQNHMLQMLALVAMEEPHAFDATSIRDMRADALKAITCGPKDVAACVVRGQYEGYRKEKNVDPNSQTETFVALKLGLRSKRWKGVPFYVKTGKKLDTNVTEISIHYKKPAVCFGDACLFPEKDVLRNVLSLRIQPDDGIHLRLMVKEPGFGMKLAPTSMVFHYKQAFPDFSQPEAYEKLFLDAIRGDQTLFARTDGVEASWQLITKILEVKAPVHFYKPGSMGPKEANNLIEKDSRHWFLHEDTVK